MDVVDGVSWHNDDDIIMEAFGNSSVDQLKWATKRCLLKTQKILDEGWTSGDEDVVIRRCSEAIGHIDAGGGSGSF